MTEGIKQKFQIDTAEGTSEIIADSYRMVDGAYMFYSGTELVQTVSVEDIVREYDDETGEQTKGIQTILSRSVI